MVMNWPTGYPSAFRTASSAKIDVLAGLYWSRNVGMSGSRMRLLSWSGAEIHDFVVEFCHVIGFDAR
jgi:hypothetical protein